MKLDYFHEKKIWITGASSGIGKGLANLLSLNGAELILSSRNLGELEKVQSELEHPEKSIIRLIDMADRKSIKEACTFILSNHEIDLIIFNAGISQRSSVLDSSFETEDKIMNTNFTGVTRMLKPILRKMVQRNNGHIVVISSVTGKIGVPDRSSYAASKHALQGYFNSLRAEVEDDGIDITIICPGYIHTDISMNALLGNGKKHVKKDANSANGMSVEKFSKKALKAISNKRAEVYIGGKEIFGIYLYRFFPSLLRRIIKKRMI